MNMPIIQSPFNVFNRISMAPPLYVGNLDENVNDETLFHFFYRFGPIHFVRVMRDPSTGKSRGFAYVNFVNPRDADSARQYAMYDVIGKKAIRIMLKRNVRDLDPKANLFVKNLDPAVTNKDLYDLFLQVRPVISVHISNDASGKSLGYGYAQFENPEDAQAVLAQLNNYKLKESEIHLAPFVPRENRGSNVKQRNIYVKNLPLNTSEDEVNSAIKKLFSKYGEIETMVCKKHPKDNKYSAFVCFKNEDAAQAAVTDLTANPPTLTNAEGPLYVNWHQNRIERHQELKKLYSQNRTNLYVKNLRLDVTNAEVQSAFQIFGNVLSVDTKEWKRGEVAAKFGFISFATEEEAIKALNESLKEPTVQKLFLSTARPYIRFHQPRDRRNEFLYTQRRRHDQIGMMMQNPNFFANRRFQPFTNLDNQGGFRQPNRGGRPGPRGGPQGRGGFVSGPRHKFVKPGFRPMPYDKRQQRPQHPHQQAQQPEIIPQGSETVNIKNRLDHLMSMAPDRQREVLGELLFPLVKQRAGEEIAPKITGMLVDLEVLTVPEIIEFLESPEILDERIAEALTIVEEESNM